MTNTITVSISFQEAIDFEKVIERIFTLLRYLEILVGRPQNVLKLYICLDRTDERSNFLQVYWSMPPQREPSHEERRPHPSSVLLDAVLQPDVFSSVLTSWLERQPTWQDARFRFSNSFAYQQCYSIDRLIGAANMFDILPDTAVPSVVELSEELASAKKECHAIFKKLPISLERSSVLDALGRVGKSALRHKIRHRTQLVIEADSRMKCNFE